MFFESNVQTGQLRAGQAVCCCELIERIVRARYFGSVVVQLEFQLEEAVGQMAADSLSELSSTTGLAAFHNDVSEASHFENVVGGF